MARDGTQRHAPRGKGVLVHVTQSGSGGLLTKFSKGIPLLVRRGGRDNQ